MTNKTVPQIYTEQWDGEGSALSLSITETLYDKSSSFQQITVYQTECFGRLLTLDGLVMLTQRDNFIYHEMLVHPALFSHPQPESVLIIGGGDCGTLSEVLKHPGVKRVQQVELDEQVTRVCKTYFPELCASNTDPRVELIFDDGIRWVDDCAANSFDLIIVDSTDPVGPAAGLFAESFYRACYEVLAFDGILIAQSESPLFHVPLMVEMNRKMTSAGFESVDVFQFPMCTYPSGWWSTMMARKSGSRAVELAEVAVEIDTRYYNAGIHQAAKRLPQFLLEALAGSS